MTIWKKIKYSFLILHFRLNSKWSKDLKVLKNREKSIPAMTQNLEATEENIYKFKDML